MPFLVIDTWYPAEIAADIVKKWLEARAAFPFDQTLGKETIMAITHADSTGLHGLAVYESKEGKLDELYARTSSALFSMAMPNFHWEITVYSSLAESMPRLGMEPPEE